MLVLAAVLPPLAMAMPLVEKRLIDGVVLAKRLDLLPETLAIYGGLWLLITTIHVVSAPLRVYVEERLLMQLRQRLLVHCEKLSIAFSREEHSGRTMSLFSNDVPSVASLFSTTALGGVGAAVAMVIGAVLMFSMNWQLALVAGVAPPLVAGIAALATRPLRPASRKVQEKTAELTERLQENLEGIREIVAFGREPVQKQRFTATLRELLSLRMRMTFMDTAIQSGQSVFSLVVTLAVVGYGGYLVIQGETTLGTLVAMRSLFGYVFQSAGQLISLVSSVQKSLGAADRVFAMLDEEPRVREASGARDLHRIEGAISFSCVSFGYQPDRLVLNNVTFDANPGEMIALVGPSGAGKSTMMSLVSRFYDPTEGCILLDGVDLRELTIVGLRRHIAMVFQDTFLFATSVRENIAIGLDGAGEAQIIAAAHAANAWEFIETLPQGLDTYVGERGFHLSEGQKQRIAIARALLRDPRILILDEPTSALDARSEHLLQGALENLVRHRTTFVIAHRLVTVQRSDRILVLEGGRIVEQGSHAELMRARGLYRELFDLQFAGNLPVIDGARAAAGGATLAVTPS